MMIVIEGLDGSGKSTLCAALKQMFEEYEHTVIPVREPGSTQLSESIRDLLKNPVYKESMTDLSELLLFYAARRSVLEHVTVPALRQNHIVIYDRFNVSTVAYQGLGLGLLQEVQHLTKMVLADFKPDMYVYIEIDEQVALKRRAQATELDRIEQKGPEYLKRVRDGFGIALRDCGVPVVVVDGNQSADALARETFDAVYGFFLKEYNRATSPNRGISSGIGI